MSGAGLFVAVLLACAVEAVEATTIVLAVGSTRGWRPAFLGVVTGLVILAVIVGALGPAVSAIPLRPLHVVIGGVLAIVGVQWLRKAVLRASGRKALHDEDAIYQRQVAAAQTAEGGRRRLVGDRYAFTLSLKGVVLEGTEVVVIVVTFGSNAHDVALAALAAGVALLAVVAAGFALRAPLARVPENTMKFVVAVLLCSFGLFWVSEGAGASWPGGDAALVGIVPAVAVLALLVVTVLRRSTPTVQQRPG